MQKPIDTLLDDLFPDKRFRVKRLPALFVPCPMCAGSTNVNFSTSMAKCEICGQKWNLHGEPISGERGNADIWRRRQKYVEAKKNGNGHKYGFDDEEIVMREYAHDMV